MIQIHNSIPDATSLMMYLNDTYDLHLDKIYLYRDMIGAVYFLWEKDKRYVYKLYRAFDTAAAIQATQIMAYLKAHNFPVVTMIPTKSDRLYSTLTMPEGERVGILFEHVEGQDADINEDVVLIGELTGRMHKLMESYDANLRKLGREHYIDRFLKVMSDLSWDSGKITEMNKYATELWENILTLPQGFTHGDLHTGNLIKRKNGEMIFLDFDIASYSYPIFDVATICDDTDFRTVHAKDLEKTYRNFEKFYTGYSKERKLTEEEKSAVFDCIAIHHYELNGTIPLYRVPMEGNHWLNERWFELHYTWAMDWKNAPKKF